jgi:catechol 2,3-dioxygenase-like lactoylglutathione lyase family enzyme
VGYGDQAFERKGANKMRVQGVTISVSDLARSKAFYEDVLGFVPDAYYAPTRWQPYKFEGRAYLALIEVPGFQRQAGGDIVNFQVQEIEAFWNRVCEQVTVEAELADTPWGSFKFVIQDPDGYRLGFVGKK